MNSTPPGSWYDHLLFSALAAVAGLLGHHMRNVNSRRHTTFKRSLLEAASSGFIGFLTVLLCRAMNIPYEWTGFIAGVLGWLGATASIQLFERAVRRKLGLSDENVIGNEESGDEPVHTSGSDSVVPGGGAQPAPVHPGVAERPANQDK